jgi:exonuclease SbcC
MKILRLRLSNLASLAGEQELDYRTEPLASAGLMAITGPTGSGKSTILDALCLALFGQVPRLRAASKGQEGKVPDGLNNDPLSMDDPRTLLRRGTTKGYAEVLFIGQNGREYTASWSVRRARDKSDGKLQAIERILKDVETGQTLANQIKDTDAQISALIGLSFEQFTRAVMLAQSEFGAFLKASDAERAQLLERLLATDIYRRLGMLAHEKSKKYKDAWLHVTAQLGGLVPLDGEQRLQLEHSIGTLEQQRKQLERDKTQLLQTQSWHLQHQQLTLQIASYSAAATHSADVWHQLAPQRDQVQLLEQLHSIRPDIQRQLELSASIALLHEQHSVFTEQLLTTQTQLSAATQAYADAEHTATTVETTLNAAKPYLQLATTLEHDLNRLNTARSELDTQLAALNLQAATAEHSITTNNQLQAQATAQITACISQLAHSQSLAALDEHWPAKLARMRDAQQYSLAQVKLIAVLPQHAQVLQDATQALDTITGHLTTLEQQFGSETALSTQLAELKQNLQSSRLKDQQLQVLSQQYLGYRHLLTQITTLKSKQTQLEQRRDTLSTTLQQAIKDSEHAEIELNATLKTIAAQRLLRSQNVVALRSQLQPEQPCPVCGSEDHPYVVDHLLDAIQGGEEQQEQHARHQHSTILKQQHGIETELKLINAELGEQAQTLNLQLNAEKHAKHALMQLPYAAELRTHATDEAERETWLSVQIKANQDSEQYLSAQISGLDQQLISLQGLLKQVELRRLQHTQAQHAHQSLTLQQGTLESQLNDAESHFWEGLDSTWQGQWRADPANTLQQLQSHMQDRLRQQSDIQRLNEQQKSLAHALQLLTLQHAQEQATLTDLTLQREARQADLLRSQNQLTALLASASSTLQVELSSVAQWQTQLDSQHTAAQRLLKAQTEARIQIEHQLQRLSSQLEHNNQQQHTEAKARQTAIQRIQTWQLAHAELTEAAFSTLLAVSTEQEQQLKAQIRQAQVSLADAETRLHVHQQQLDQHLLQTAGNLQIPEAELAAAISSNAAQWQESEQLWLSLKLQLKQDDDCKAKAASLQAELDQAYAAYLRIDRMTSPIASSDGNKFQKFAQEYFLDRLLDDANLQLEQLSRRYQLERAAGSLGLLVIDTDMGDERRSVHSLSGGESFLVSLALALGLAEMASNRLRIESLFIDEGFGTLDPDSLQIVMDALDRLQGQGRKVTVITHVQEMHERIPTQIQVHKKGNGQSALKVV